MKTSPPTVRKVLSATELWGVTGLALAGVGVAIAYSAGGGSSTTNADGTPAGDLGTPYMIEDRVPSSTLRYANAETAISNARRMCSSMESGETMGYAGAINTLMTYYHYDEQAAVDTIQWSINTWCPDIPYN